MSEETQKATVMKTSHEEVSKMASQKLSKKQLSELRVFVSKFCDIFKKQQKVERDLYRKRAFGESSNFEILWRIITDYPEIAIALYAHVGGKLSEEKPKEQNLLNKKKVKAPEINLPNLCKNGRENFGEELSRYSEFELEALCKANSISGIKKGQMNKEMLVERLWQKIVQEMALYEKVGEAERRKEV